MRLIADRLGVDRGGRPILRDVSFAVAGGEALKVVGPNGAGKSTLLRALAGLIAPVAGDVRLDGGDPEAPPREAMHLLGHLDAVKAGLSVRRNIVFARDVLGGEGDVDASLDRVGLGALADLPGSVLSAGQKRRLALARLLAAPRPVWLLDEPTAALDASGQALLAELVAEHRAKGGLVVAATHLDMGFEAARLELGAVAAVS
ncbi:heme ABC exporter ATP-binding protein CcmA [Methylopila turkensis]|uniref:Cytochrome c biogenesis ATP-binding export protein CcmA n=1 Tax=Methylopila turkensis TaxID=1437816 RepID=A0A9W6JSX0_9HYPH|nr:heme ABC exporter ATP-binding protein CcmA [Methylopila turkensis]GLK81858.1 cytochrome c biogenesis ATP-binding export protein CcmA [Methylopila turkensis]